MQEKSCPECGSVQNSSNNFCKTCGKEFAVVRSENSSKAVSIGFIALGLMLFSLLSVLFMPMIGYRLTHSLVLISCIHFFLMLGANIGLIFCGFSLGKSQKIFSIQTIPALAGLALWVVFTIVSLVLNIITLSRMPTH